MNTNTQCLKKITPVLKWAGGKTQILDIIKRKLTDSYNHYYEPFIGGASVLFDIMSENVQN